MQIRRAQRTYRQKKEATIETLRNRVELLEQTLQNVSNILTTSDDNTALALGSNTYDLAHAKKLILAEIKQAQSPTGDQWQDTEHLRDLFGYSVSPEQEINPFENTTAETKHPQARSPSPLLNRLFPTTTIYTYSNQESNFSRRLQRFCLEHTYRWLTDARSEPVFLSRVFGLLPCIQDMPGVCRAFRRLVRSEIGSPLESDKLPFYTLGGAGTHFPCSTEDGEPVYPENIRRPGKIIRRMMRILRRGGIQDWDEDWSGDAEPDTDAVQHALEMAMAKEDRLRALDLDGEWFDCRDVQGYLEQRGVTLNGSSMWLEVPSVTVSTLYMSPGSASASVSASQMYISSSETSPSEGTGLLDQPESYALNVECFFDREFSSMNLMDCLLIGSLVLLSDLRILGRAPGFRLWDVDVALRTSIQRRPFG